MFASAVLYTTSHNESHLRFVRFTVFYYREHVSYYFPCTAFETLNVIFENNRKTLSIVEKLNAIQNRTIQITLEIQFQFNIVIHYSTLQCISAKFKIRKCVRIPFRFNNRSFVKTSLHSLLVFVTVFILMDVVSKT